MATKGKSEASPYFGIDQEKWAAKTARLIAKHPLFNDPGRTLGHVEQAWDGVWQTKIGTGSLAVPFRDIDPLATVVGAFFEKLLAHGLKKAGGWRGQATKDEKDIVCTTNPDFSFEVKTSGQKTGGIYGNRSFNQEGKGGAKRRKSKSGYYLCVNFWEDRIFKVQVGWIDEEDWAGQASATGQQASLPDYVYEHQLVTLHGNYELHAPIFPAIRGVGESKGEELSIAGLVSIADVVSLLKKRNVTVPEFDTLDGDEIARRLGVERNIAKTLTTVVAADYFLNATSKTKP